MGTYIDLVFTYYTEKSNYHKKITNIMHDLLKKDLEITYFRNWQGMIL